MDIGNQFITYTENEDIESPLHRIPINDCFAIKIGEGELQAIANGTAVLSSAEKTEVSEHPDSKKKEDTSFPKKLDPVPAPDNQEIVRMFNSSKILDLKKQPNLKKLRNGNVTTIWGLLPESILSDKNVTVLINGINPGYINLTYTPTYQLSVYNKTKDNIYIDLANSFRIDRMGQASSFHDPNIYTSMSGKSGGGAINLGAAAGALGIGGAIGTLASGITMGANQSSGIQVTESQDRILVIPPGGTINMPLRNIMVDKNRQQVGECFDLDFLGKSSEELNLHENEIVTLDPQNLGITNRYLISYSKDPEFSEYVQIPINFYLRGIYGNGLLDSLKRRNFNPAPQAFLIYGLSKIQKSK